MYESIIFKASVALSVFDSVFLSAYCCLFIASFLLLAYLLLIADDDFFSQIAFFAFVVQITYDCLLFYVFASCFYFVFVFQINFLS